MNTRRSQKVDAREPCGWFEWPMTVVAHVKFKRREPGGFTLVELLVVVTLLAGVMILTGTTFSLLMRSEKLVSQSLVTERSIARLACQFRDDVHQSEVGEVIPASPTSVNQLALRDSQGGQVRYRVTKEGVARLLVEGDATVGREDFRLPDCFVRIFAGKDPLSSLRTMTIERPMATMTRTSQAPAPLRSLEIQAYLNRRQPTIRRTDLAESSSHTTRNTETAEESK